MQTAVKRRAYNATLRREQAQLTKQRILDAGRRLLVSGTYSSVTMEDIAREAGVAYQTVYSIFRTKLGLAHAIIEAGFPHVADAMKLLDQARASDEPETWVRITARMARLILEPCADLVRFNRESGDPALLARYRGAEQVRFDQMRELQALIEASGRLKDGVSGDEALAVVWAMTSSELYTQLVFERGWTPSRYEKWLGDSLIMLLLKPANESHDL
jgi:AcrR family transcriptional regulator